MNQNGSLLETLLEFQHLDRVPRMGYVLRGVADPESVAEHSWHVAVLVWTLGRDLPGLDLSKAVSMALLHDVGEVRLGDLPMTVNKYFKAGAKADAEAEVVRELTAPMGSKPVDFLAELRARETPESRLVKDCDKLHLMLKVAHYEAHGARGLSEFWGHPENFPSDEFPSVSRLFADLVEWRNSQNEPQATKDD